MQSEVQRDLVAEPENAGALAAENVPVRFLTFLAEFFSAMSSRLASQSPALRSAGEPLLDNAVRTFSADRQVRRTRPEVLPQSLRVESASPSSDFRSAGYPFAPRLWEPVPQSRDLNRDRSFSWRRVLILAPHPDDESLATGCLLQRAVAAGAVVRVLFATSGEHNPWPQRFVERKWSIRDHDRARWGNIREREALAALEQLGVPRTEAHFLGFPDSGLHALSGKQSADLVRTLTMQLVAFRPDLLVVPSRADLHSDHRTLGTLVRRAVGRAGRRMDGVTEVAYLVHGAAPAVAPAFSLSLAPEERSAKKSAILCHSSQLSLSRKRMLGFVRAHEIYYDADSLSLPRLGQLQRIWEIVSGI